MFRLVFIGLHLYAVLPSRIEPGFGYIALYRLEQGPAPNLDKLDPIQPDLGVPQAGPAKWHVPLGNRAPLASPTLVQSRTLQGGGAKGDGWGCLGQQARSL